MDERPRLTPEEVETIARSIIEEMAKGRSLSTSVISVGVYILLTGLQNPNRVDMIVLGAFMLGFGYLYNRYRQIRAKSAINDKLTR